MISDYTCLPTDVLLEFVITILDLEGALTSRDAAELGQLLEELQRRLETKTWQC